MKKTAKFAFPIFIIIGVYSVYAQYQKTVGIFTFQADEKDSLIVQELAGFSIESQLKYQLFFDYEIEKPIHVYLAATGEDYDRYNPPLIPDWSSGIAYVHKRLIVLKPGLYYDPDRYKETIYHEMAHMFIADIVHDTSVPVWFNEGVAMYLSGKSISWGESITIGNALSAGKIIDLSAIDSLLYFNDAQAKLAYLESFHAVQFLIARYNEEVIVGLIKNLGKEKSFNQAFFIRCGDEFELFEIEWYDDLKKRYGWIQFLQFENVLWVTLVFLFFLVYVIKKIRNRRMYKIWDQNEQSG